jgi:hypothetical protein
MIGLIGGCGFCVATKLYPLDFGHDSDFRFSCPSRFARSPSILIASSLPDRP